MGMNDVFVGIICVLQFLDVIGFYLACMYHNAILFETIFTEEEVNKNG